MNADDPNSPHRRHGADMLLDKDQVKKWMADVRFYPAEEFDLFGKAKWFIIYLRR